ncbi:MAG: hypothetical protein AB7F43_13565 [Bacteriovoracia bacterium]
MIQLIYLIALFFSLITNAADIEFDPSLVRPWRNTLESESLLKDPYIAHHKNNPHELFYLASHHQTELKSKTILLVKKLFRTPTFKAVIIESIPFASGESPRWFIEDAKQNLKSTYIKGGESSMAAILANTHSIPLFGGELDHKDIYDALKTLKYSDLDIVGFYLARQIPQWIREKEEKKGLLKRKAPKFLSYYCKKFGINSCPRLSQIQAWYQSKNKSKLTSNVTTEQTAPFSDGKLFTQKISSDLGKIRDRFTLSLIQSLLNQYKSIAVIYGESHYLTLKKSLDQQLGPAVLF